jgi:uncharacterized protein UPF0164
MGKALKSLLILISINCIVQAQTPSSSGGTASVLMLRLGTSAKVSAISEAFTGLANDENSLFYNVAGLANINSGILSLNHMEWFQDVRIDNISFAYKFGKNFGSAMSISHMWMKSIDGFDEQGFKTNPFNVSSSIVNLGLGYKVVSGFSLGFGLKLFQDRLADYNGSGMAFDLGMYMKTVVPGLSMGVTVQNMGANVIYDKKAQRIPITYRAGFAYTIPAINLTFVSDAVKSVDSEFVFNLGAEYNFVEYVTARIGNRFSSNETFTPSFGIGFQYNRQYYINYTFCNLDILGSTHRFGFTYQFGNKTYSSKQKYSPKTFGKPKLIPPDNLEVEIEDEKLIISWDKVTGARYLVYARYGLTGEWKKLIKSPLYSNSLKIKKLPEKGKYFFRVSSIINEKESEFSKEEQIEIE